MASFLGPLGRSRSYSLLDCFPEFLAATTHSLAKLFTGCHGLALLNFVAGFLASSPHLLPSPFKAAAYRFRSHSQFAGRLGIKTPGDRQVFRLLVLTNARSCTGTQDTIGGSMIDFSDRSQQS